MADDIMVRELQEKVAPLVGYAQAAIVRTKDDANDLSQKVAWVKQWRKGWCAHHDPDIKKADDLHKSLLAKKKVGTALADEFIDLAGGKVLAWQSAENERVAAEQRRLQAIADEQARKERERVEALARAQREKEEAARRAEAEARAKAQQEQDAARRAELEAEAERQRKEAEKRAAMAAEREEKAEAVPLAPIITLTADKAAAGGASVKTTWKAECVSLSDLTGIPTMDIRLTFVVFDQKSADAFARATKGRTPVPGVRFFEAKSLSNRIKE